MAIDQDPYRTLGLSRGASIDEIKRAYRRLAKIHHPDAAGEKNVPRFLAIQAAYEQLAGGLDGAGPAGRPGAPRRPWQADPDRSDATRRAYGGRARGPVPGAGASRPTGGSSTAGSPGNTSGARGSSAGPGGGPAAGPRPRPSSTRSSRRGSGKAEEPASSAGADAGATDRSPRGPRERKRSKATLGSTSYDGVDGPFEPDWRGASWYGTTSGTYWTLNPKEYADPRKHGPEYQARARRATRQRPPDGGDPDPASPPPTEAVPDEPLDAPEAAAGPMHTTSSWWESTAGATEPAAATTDPRGPRPTDQAAPPPAPPDVGRALGDIGRALTDPGFGGQRGRVMRALLGWLPIAFGVSWVVGEVTGCGRFAATCTDFADPLTLVVQVVALAVLLLFPVVASIAAIGALTLLGAAVVAALILSATGAAADTDSRRAALGAVLLIAWLAGIAVAVAKRVRSPSSTTRPVS